MSKHFTVKAALFCAIPAVASFALAGGAAASPSPNVSFAASNDGASAGWTDGPGSPIDLTLGDTTGSYAEVTPHQTATKVSDLTEPTFVTNNYAAGSPRYFIILNNGDTLWGYPPNSGLNGTDFAWAINNGNTYLSWATVQSDEGTARVTGAHVIADADQSAGTVDMITGMTFGSNTYN